MCVLVCVCLLFLEYGKYDGRWPLGAEGRSAAPCCRSRFGLAIITIISILIIMIIVIVIMIIVVIIK